MLELRDQADTWSVRHLDLFPSSLASPSLLLRHGKGVQKAVHNVNNLIAPDIVAKCMDPLEKENIE